MPRKRPLHRRSRGFGQVRESAYNPKKQDCVLTIIALSLVQRIIRPHTGLPGVAEYVIAYYSTVFAFVLEYWTKASRVLIALGLTLLAGSKSCSFGCSGDIRR
jgi:hypothetical protein